MKGIQLMFAKECELSGAKQKSPRLNCREVNAMTFDELRYIEFNKKKRLFFDYHRLHIRLGRLMCEGGSIF